MTTSLFSAVTGFIASHPHFTFAAVSLLSLSESIPLGPQRRVRIALLLIDRSVIVFDRRVYEEGISYYANPLGRPARVPGQSFRHC